MGTLSALALADIDTLLGSLSLDGSVLAYDSEQSLLLVSGEPSVSLAVVDVSTPGTPAVLGTLTSAYTAGVTAMLSDYYSVVIASATSTSISLVSLLAPTAPVVLTTIVNAAFANVSGLARVQAGYIYAACVTDSSIKVLNLAGVVASLSDATKFAGLLGIVKSGVYLLTVGPTNSWLSVVDVSTPTSPTIIGSLTHAGLALATDFQVDGDYLAVATSDGKIHMYSIADLTAPVFLFTYTNVAAIGTDPRFLVIGGIYYVVNSSAELISVFDFRTDTQSNFDNYLEDLEAFRFDFDGEYHTDSRICLEFYGPATLCAVTYEVDDTDNPPRNGS